MFVQAVDGQKGEKGDCRMDDNLVGATHPLSSSRNILMPAAKGTSAWKTNCIDKFKPCSIVRFIAANDAKALP